VIDLHFKYRIIFGIPITLAYEMERIAYAMHLSSIVSEIKMALSNGGSNLSVFTHRTAIALFTLQFEAYVHVVT
jgi:hypothetical protein